MIRNKVLGQLLVIMLVCLGLFAGYYLLMLRSYERLEQADLELNRHRVLNALDQEIERLDEVTRGWAASGLVNQLAVSRTLGPYRDPFINAISGSFDIRELVVVGADNQLIVARESDPVDEYVDIPLDENAPFVRTVLDSGLGRHEYAGSVHKGLAYIDGSIHLISSHPNLDFEGGQGASSLIAAIHYNEAAVARLERIVEQEITIMPLDEFLADDQNLAILELIRDDPSSSGFVPVSQSHLSSYTLLNDYKGTPAFILQIEAQRNFFEQASRTLLIVGLGGGLMFIVLIAWFLLFLDKSVLRRLQHLSAAVEGLDDAHLKQRLPVRGSDEISAVSMAFNGLLDSLQHSQKALVRQATHDALTGLINRHQFEYELEAALHAVRGGLRTHHLMFLDLDRFKIVNDSCGHMAGDIVLKDLAALMRAQLRSTDVLGRIGGDEFGVILLDCDPVMARELAGNLREAVSSFRFEADNHQFTFGASIGLVHLNALGMTTRAAALTIADSACRIAKNAGRNRVHEHRGQDERLSQQLQQTLWVNRITEALERDLFSLYFQKIVSLEPSAPHCNAEVLLRLRGEDGEVIAPGVFLPAAERYHMMVQIDRWVITHFFTWFATHVGQLDEIDCFSVNLSGQSLGDPEFLEFLSTELSRHQMPVNRICFEITETSLIENLVYTGRFIRSLKELGCRFALDDFGAGMSSFTYLRNLPVDVLKIEGMFCKNIRSSAIDRAMVSSINEIGHLMNLQTVAEYVETAETLAICQELGIDYAQGFHLHRPEPLENCLTKRSEVI
ncbi:MAG: EAL domain-containing protein [Pseudomonadota bacterium]